jgi:hypothetical protein
MQFPDNFAYVIFVDEHELLHTADHPFCWNSTCECHEDQEAILAVQQYILDGLMTPDEATLFVSGRTV